MFFLDGEMTLGRDRPVGRTQISFQIRDADESGHRAGKWKGPSGSDRVVDCCKTKTFRRKCNSMVSIEFKIVYCRS